MAESITLRGARRNGKTVTVHEAAAALDASLMAEGQPFSKSPGIAMACNPPHTHDLLVAASHSSAETYMLAACCTAAHWQSRRPYLQALITYT